MQNDFLGWQSTTQEKKGKDGVNTSSEYDTWEKAERETISQNLTEPQRSHFNAMADEQDKLNRPWAKKHETEQRKAYGIETQNSYITSNKAMLAANMHDENYVNSSLGQILSATTELSRLQGLGEQETTDLKLSNVNDAIKSALQGRIDAEDWEDAAALYRRNGHYLNEANRHEITGSITALHSKAQNRKKIDDVSAKLLQMDEDAAAMHLGDNNWLGSMNIPEELIPELKEVNAYQRQSALRKEKTTKNEKEFTWFDKVLTANIKDPMEALRLVQSREDIDPELRSSVVSAIQSGRIDTIDDPATMFALQDRIFGDDPDVESGEFAIEIGKGNLKINTFKELFEMQKNLNKGEKNLVRKALHILDASFEGDEDFAGNSNRLAARNIYLKSLNKAIAENNTQELVLLTNKEHVQSVGQSFSAESVGKTSISNEQNVEQRQTPFDQFHGAVQGALGLDKPDTAVPSTDSSTWEAIKHFFRPRNNPIPEPLQRSYMLHDPSAPQPKEGYTVKERELDFPILSDVYFPNLPNWLNPVRHEQIVPTNNGKDIGLYADGTRGSETPEQFKKLFEKDSTVYPEQQILHNLEQYEQEWDSIDHMTQSVKDNLIDGDDIVSPLPRYNIGGNNCKHFTDLITGQNATRNSCSPKRKKTILSD